MVILDVVPAPDCFRVRFMGQSVPLFEGDFEGKALGTIPNTGILELVWDMFVFVRDHGLPLLLLADGTYEQHFTGHAYHVAIPLGDDDDFVTSILYGVNLDIMFNTLMPNSGT